MNACPVSHRSSYTFQEILRRMTSSFRVHFSKKFKHTLFNGMLLVCDVILSAMCKICTYVRTYVHIYVTRLTIRTYRYGCISAYICMWVDIQMCSTERIPAGGLSVPGTSYMLQLPHCDITSGS